MNLGGALGSQVVPPQCALAPQLVPARRVQDLARQDALGEAPILILYGAALAVGIDRLHRAGKPRVVGPGALRRILGHDEVAKAQRVCAEDAPDLSTGIFRAFYLAIFFTCCSKSST